MLAKGAVELSSSGVFWIGNTADAVFELPVTPRIHWSHIPYRLLPERGPPGRFTSLV